MSIKFGESVPRTNWRVLNLAAWQIPGLLDYIRIKYGGFSTKSPIHQIRNPAKVSRYTVFVRDAQKVKEWHVESPYDETCFSRQEPLYEYSVYILMCMYNMNATGKYGGNTPYSIHRQQCLTAHTASYTVDGIHEVMGQFNKGHTGNSWPSLGGLPVCLLR